MNLDDNEKGVFYMFEKPSVPLYAPRANSTLIYELPSNTLPEGVVTNRLGLTGVTSIAVQEVLKDGDIPGTVSSIPRGVPFSSFLDRHRRAAKDLIDRLMATNGVDGLKNYAANIRDKCNEGLFIFALSFVVIRKPELRKIRTPAIFEVFPDMFIPNATIGQAEDNMSQANYQTTRPERVVVEHDMDFSGTDLMLEHRVAYWREDYGINSHHWHWHLVFPLNMGVNRDRKGELFSYMHNQMLARYDMERLSNGLGRVRPLTNLREVIPDGYFSKLTLSNSRRIWGTRQDNTFLSDYERREPVSPFTIRDLETWRERLFDGIHKGYFKDRQGNRVTLSDDVDINAGQKRGIDIIGDAFEADSELSVNFPFYGDLHNFGHVAIAFSHDPDGSHREEIGVMGSTATAMRDPVFYRWHRFVDEVFQTFKNSQPPYRDEELNVANIDVERLGVATGNEANIIHTFYDMKMIEASRGLDFGAATPVFVNLTRLNHRPFTYHILVNNTSSAQKRVTVRIFMAPKFNQAGQTMPFMEQKTLWAELDRFDYALAPGKNHIKQESTNSSVTIPDELTFRELEEGSAAMEAPEAYCGCGWPNHMLVPRGRPEGMVFELFVALSDYELDRVNGGQTGGERRCGNASSFCGILDERYPDRRPMGFPLDRRVGPDVDHLSTNDIFGRYGNISLMDITIRFTNRMMGGQGTNVTTSTTAV